MPQVAGGLFRRDARHENAAGNAGQNKKFLKRNQRDAVSLLNAAGNAGQNKVIENNQRDAVSFFTCRWQCRAKQSS